MRWLGTSIASLASVQQALVVGSNIRKEHPLFAQRLRQATKHGAQIYSLNEHVYDWAMPLAHSWQVASEDWLLALAALAVAVAAEQGVQAPVAGIADTGISLVPYKPVAQQWIKGQGEKLILLGNAAAHHEQASEILTLANWIADRTGAKVGYLTEAANTVGAQFVGAVPASADALNAEQMLTGALKAVILLGNEPEFDSAVGTLARKGLASADMVISLNPFEVNHDICDVLLPIAPFTETSGTFVNAEGRVQSFHAVVKPLGETRPAWKVLRVLANLLGLQGFAYESSQEVLARIFGSSEIPSFLPVDVLSNASNVAVSKLMSATRKPVVAPLYQLDGIVRRAPSLQQTLDAQKGLLAGLPEPEVIPHAVVRAETEGASA